MKYNPSIHITYADLARYLGVSTSKLRVLLKAEGGVQPAFVGIFDGKNKATIFDRAAALAWIDSAGLKRAEPAATPMTTRKPTAPPANWNLMQRKPWTPKGRLAENFARAGEVYPHELRSQGKCIGNGAEHQHGFGRGR